MCRTHRVLVLLMLYMRLVHSWDIAISVEDRLEFYTNGIKTDTVYLTPHIPAAITYDEVHNMILFVDKRSYYDAVCGYNLASKDIRCFIKRTDSNIQDLAFDPVTNLLFFTDIKYRSINWISLKDQVSENNDFGNILLIMEDRIVNEIALDSCSGYIYWANTDKVSNEFMERARFNGSGREVVNELLPVFSFAIDPLTHTNYYINGFSYEFHNEVDLRENYLKDEGSKLIFYFMFLSKSKQLTITNDYIYWMNSTLDYTTVWQRPKNVSTGNIELRETCKFYYEKPLGIAANYQIKDQVQRLQDCEASSSLVTTAEITNNFLSSVLHNIEHTKQKPQTLETNQITETEPTTEGEDTVHVDLVSLETNQTTETEPTTEGEDTVHVDLVSLETNQTTETEPTTEGEDTVHVDLVSLETNQTTETEPTTEGEDTVHVDLVSLETNQTTETEPTTEGEDTVHVDLVSLETNQTTETEPTTEGEDTVHVDLVSLETNQTTETEPTTEGEDTVHVDLVSLETNQTTETEPTTEGEDTVHVDLVSLETNQTTETEPATEGEDTVHVDLVYLKKKNWFR